MHVIYKELLKQNNLLLEHILYSSPSLKYFNSSQKLW